MKSILVVFSLFLIIALVNATNAGINLRSTSFSIDNSNSGKNISKSNRNKDGRFKRKKGFMWGLFKKKSACDCPKH